MSARPEDNGRRRRRQLTQVRTRVPSRPPPACSFPPSSSSPPHRAAILLRRSLCWGCFAFLALTTSTLTSTAGGKWEGRGGRKRLRSASFPIGRGRQRQRQRHRRLPFEPSSLSSSSCCQSSSLLWNRRRPTGSGVMERNHLVYCAFDGMNEQQKGYRGDRKAVGRGGRGTSGQRVNHLYSPSVSSESDLPPPQVRVVVLVSPYNGTERR